jgi:hypothetical protein
MLQLLQTWTPEEIQTALTRPDRPDLRRHIGIWIGELLPADRLVPDAYQQWRPLVRDSIAFVFSKLPPARLAAKITDQLKLPIDTPPEVRLIHSIRRMPRLQKLGKVLFTLDGVLRDVTGGEISLDEMIAKYLSGRWYGRGNHLGIGGKTNAGPILGSGVWPPVWSFGSGQRPRARSFAQPSGNLNGSRFGNFKRPSAGTFPGSNRGGGFARGGRR